MGTPLGTAVENDDTGKVIAYSLAVGIPYGNKVLSLEEDHDPVHGFLSMAVAFLSGCPITPLTTRSLDSSSHSSPISRQSSGASNFPLRFLRSVS